MEEKIKKLIHSLIREYYQEKFAGQKFIPGETHIPASGKAFDERELLAMTDAVLDGWWTEGRFAAEFEKKFAEFVGVPYCITTNSGSSANLLAVSALTSFHLGKRRLQPGDEVITIAAGFPTTINPLIIHRLVPVFADIDPKTFNIDIEKMKKLVSKKTRAIFMPHNLGNPFNLDEVRKICRRYKLWLIEDCCDALGSTYRGKRVGGFGDLATFSFYAAHHITTGEGGAVVTKDPKLAAIVRSFRDWGREYWFRTGEDTKRDKGLGSRKHGKLPADYDNKFIFSEIGYNLRLTDMQAALGVVQLSKLPQFIEHRKKSYQMLRDKLSGFSDLISFQEPEKHSDPSWFGFLITLNPKCPFTRKEMIDYLLKLNIGTRMLLAGNLPKQPYMQTYKVKSRSGNLSATDYALSNSFWVGVHQGIDKTRQSYLINALIDFLSRFPRK